MLRFKVLNFWLLVNVVLACEISDCVKISIDNGHMDKPSRNWIFSLINCRVFDSFNTQIGMQIIQSSSARFNAIILFEIAAFHNIYQVVE
jgi:hypothetical protein